MDVAERSLRRPFRRALTGRALVLAVLVVIVFLRSWRASAIILITIPATLALSIIGILLAGYTFNIMTLGAIAAAVGLMIDDAVIVVEVSRLSTSVLQYSMRRLSCDTFACHTAGLFFVGFRGLLILSIKR